MTLAILFDSVGVGEWFVLLAVVLIVCGPKRLPQAARTIGQYYAKFRRAAENFKRQLMDLDTEFDRAARTAVADAGDAYTTDPAPASDDSVAGEGAAAGADKPEAGV